MTDTEFEEAVAKLETAIAAPDGVGIKPIRRIEYELLDNGLIRWTLWEQCPGLHGATRWKMAYSSVLHHEELGGPLAGTKMILEAQASEVTN